MTPTRPSSSPSHTTRCMTESPFSYPSIPPETSRLRRDARGTQEVAHLIDDPEMLREITAIYYAATTHVDHDIGILLAALDERGLTENTIILFPLRSRRHDGRPRPHV